MRLDFFVVPSFVRNTAALGLGKTLPGSDDVYDKLPGVASTAPRCALCAMVDDELYVPPVSDHLDCGCRASFACQFEETLVCGMGIHSDLSLASQTGKSTVKELVPQRGRQHGRARNAQPVQQAASA